MEQAIFKYPTEFVTLPEYTAHAGQVVEIVRALTSAEADGPEQGEEQMYQIRAEDGWVGHAFDSELERI
jgi:hypothetical protein